jgi:hypothetical protein
MPQGFDYFGDTKDALRMMIPLAINRRNIEASALEQEKRIAALKEQAQAELQQKVAEQKAEEERANRKLEVDTYLKQLEGAQQAGAHEHYQALAGLLSHKGVNLPQYFSSPEGVNRYRMLPPQLGKGDWTIKDTAEGLMHIPSAPRSGIAPVPIGVKGPQQKWEVYPPGPPKENDPIVRTVDLGDKVRVFNRDNSYEDLPKNPSPTATEQSTRPPKGYRWNDRKELEAIPGGPADEKTQFKYAQERASYESTISELDRLGEQAEELMLHPGLGGITGMMGAIPNWPGSESSNAEAMLDTLKSQIAFSVLQAMRNASKTGGALGQVSDTEGKRLENNLAALDKAQSYDAYRKALKKIVDYVKDAKGRIGGVFEQTWSDVANGRSRGPTTGEGLQLNTADDYLKNKFGE